MLQANGRGGVQPRLRSEMPQGLVAGTRTMPQVQLGGLGGRLRPRGKRHLARIGRWRDILRYPALRGVQRQRLGVLFVGFPALPLIAGFARLRKLT